MSFWKQAVVWTKIKDTIALVGTTITAGLELGNSTGIFKTPQWGAFISLSVTFLGILLGMWFEDKDKDGTVDLFQTTVTSTGPVEVETKKKDEA